MRDRHKRIVGVRAGLVGVGGGCVDDVGASIDLSLGDRVAGGVVPGFTHIEFIVRSRCTGGQYEVADEGVNHGDAGQGLVAGVLHGNGVADHLACVVGRTSRHSGIFDDVECGLLQHVAKIDIQFCGVECRDQDGHRVGGGLHPAGLLNLANDVGVVVRVSSV